MASSSSCSPPSRNLKEEVSHIDYGVSYVKIYNKKSFDDEGSADHHQQKNAHPAAPIDPTIEEQERPPYVIVVHGPPKVGKSLLIKCLVDFYTDGRSHSDMAGPVRVVAGDKRRIQFVECPNNVNGMIDAAKYADAVIFVIDAGYALEMETFEFLELLKVHGMPKVMGVLTYLDTFKNKDILVSTRQLLVNQFQTKICEGAEVFSLSGLHDAMYLTHEIANLATYISTMEFHHVSWRAAQPYLLVDHFKDVTSQETVQMDEECPRNIILEGYLRGCHLEKETKVHIAGVGDFPLASVKSLADPFPLPSVGGDLDELICTENECCRAGTYVRFEFCNVPSVMVKNYDPCQPILVGGITNEEQDVGYIQAKVELHSWHLKLLKSKDPTIVSVGWRRYQTRPIYALEDWCDRYRFLRCTPRNKPCYAIFWGPLAPPDTRAAVVQSLADNKAAFRFLANACVVDANQASKKIVKKSKRTGTPCKIFKKTALVKDMFSSDVETAIFKDAKVQTMSGIYGKINGPAGGEREGIAKCTFNHKIRKCDTIFMNVYEDVQVPCFFNPSTGPEPPDRIWEGVVDTCGANHLSAAADMDSFYKTHIDPSEPEDHKLRSMWVKYMSSQWRATTKKDKLLVKGQKNNLKVAVAKRMRELASKGVLPRRRNTLEQLRGVCFIDLKTEESMKPLISVENREEKESMKPLISVENREEKESMKPLILVENREEVLKRFEEFMKEEERKTVCPSS